LKILLSNDDGYRAEGLRCLARSLAGVAEVVTVAPDRDRSGASNSLTLDSPLRVNQIGPNEFAINGTPTDCVHLAVTGLLDDVPDMVISGINNGANLGDDVLYSGTVAAAMEGRFLGLPAVAVSLVNRGGRHYDSAARVIRRLLARMEADPLPPTTILNINVPDLPFADLKGLRATRLGHRHKAEPVVKTRDPRGRTVYWVGPAGPEEDAGPGTDFAAVTDGYVAVTPLQVDLTRHQDVPAIAAWMERGGHDFQG
jgi:5'-nucleotidase